MVKIKFKFFIVICTALTVKQSLVKQICKENKSGK